MKLEAGPEGETGELCSWCLVLIRLRRGERNEKSRGQGGGEESSWFLVLCSWLHKPEAGGAEREAQRGRTIRLPAAGHRQDVSGR